jgi:hypothetical protein
MGKSLVEKRNCLRTNLRGELIIHPVKELAAGNALEVEEKPIFGQIKNISEGGLRFRIASADRLKEIVKVNFTVERFRRVDAYARLTWKDKKDFGFKFIVLDEDSKEQIRNFVEKILRSQAR